MDEAVPESSYGGEVIPTPLTRWTLEQQLQLLDWHPVFTGRCPNCERSLALSEARRVHWDCEDCGWVDDSV